MGQDGDVRVGVFPEGEEVLVGGFCFMPCYQMWHKRRPILNVPGLLKDSSARFFIHHCFLLSSSFLISESRQY
jgi:hypothetical protein